MFDKFFEKYPVYQLQERPSFELVASYTARLPDELLSFWQNYGFGSFMNGYLNVVNPGEYKSLLKQVYASKYADAIVMFTTGLSDLIIWENGYVIALNFRTGKREVIDWGFRFFFVDICESEAYESSLNTKNYLSAVQNLGKLSFGESFGCVPSLGYHDIRKADQLIKVQFIDYLLSRTKIFSKIK
ncbi:GAD-like domain-containing protein [Sphingobacterium sp. BIGb0165]|uniref:GAD-like domain-containing protein n=1 Tax=Sphingobacterium sp. BIGb0165 TaxID=2940615 RepID=UPI002167A39E|nr:GAD-like domain-containing protein [Sphingobacterium sp. BIGb0165]MCS4226962.1 hypothetical protein [Sphingobacterium sp. BIGb0165]